MLRTGVRRRFIGLLTIAFLKPSPLHVHTIIIREMGIPPVPPGSNKWRTNHDRFLKWDTFPISTVRHPERRLARGAGKFRKSHLARKRKKKLLYVRVLGPDAKIPRKIAGFCNVIDIFFSRLFPGSFVNDRRHRPQRARLIVTKLF